MKYLLYIFIFLFAFESQSQKAYWLKDDWVLMPALFRAPFGQFSGKGHDFFMTDYQNGLLRDETDQFTTIYKVDERGNSLNLVLEDKRVWKNGNELISVPPLSSRLFVKNDLAISVTRNYADPNYNQFSTDSGMVWLSIDAGNTWDRYFTDLKDGIMDTKILDDGSIIILSGTKIAISRDTCKSWSYSEKFPTNLYDTVHTPIIFNGDTLDIITTIYAASIIECNDTNNIYVFATDIKEKMTYTSDGGKTWSVVKELPTRPLSKRNVVMSYTTTPDNKIWISGYHFKNNNDGTLDTLVYVDYSTDYGDTWINSIDTMPKGHSPEGVYLSYRPVWRIKFFDSLNGIVIGDIGFLFRTDDGGKSWHYDGKEGEIPPDRTYGSYTNFQYLSKDTIILFAFNNQRNFIIAPLHPIVHPDVSVADISDNSISIYPNPAGDFINISIDNDEGLLTRGVQIIDLLGLVVSKTELTDGNNRIDISHLARGTYFIKVGDKVEKFVKK